MPPADDAPDISIHALREEGDYSPSQNMNWNMAFLSTPSARRATPLLYEMAAIAEISIHALREEGDPPRGFFSWPRLAFLSTPSARRATAKTEKNISAFVSL